VSLFSILPKNKSQTGDLGAKHFSHARRKAAKKTLRTRQRFAALRESSSRLASSSFSLLRANRSLNAEL